MNYRLRVITAASCVFALSSVASAQPNTAPSRIEITPEHVLSINGKKTFTIGLTGPSSASAKTPDGKLALQEFREAGVVFFRPPIREDDAGGDDEWIAYQRPISGRRCALRNVLHGLFRGVGNRRTRSAGRGTQPAPHRPHVQEPSGHGRVERCGRAAVGQRADSAARARIRDRSKKRIRIIRCG